MPEKSIHRLALAVTLGVTGLLLPRSAAAIPPPEVVLATSAEVLAPLLGVLLLLFVPVFWSRWWTRFSSVWRNYRVRVAATLFLLAAIVIPQLTVHLMTVLRNPNLAMDLDDPRLREEGTRILDLRSKEAVAACRLPRSTRLQPSEHDPVDTLDSLLRDPQTHRVVVVCHTGATSAQLATRWRALRAEEAPGDRGAYYFSGGAHAFCYPGADSSRQPIRELPPRLAEAWVAAGLARAIDARQSGDAELRGAWASDPPELSANAATVVLFDDAAVRDRLHEQRRGQGHTELFYTFLPADEGQGPGRLPGWTSPEDAITRVALTLSATLGSQTAALAALLLPGLLGLAVLRFRSMRRLREKPTLMVTVAFVGGLLLLSWVMGTAAAALPAYRHPGPTPVGGVPLFVFLWLQMSFDQKSRRDALLALWRGAALGQRVRPRVRRKKTLPSFLIMVLLLQLLALHEQPGTVVRALTAAAVMAVLLLTDAVTAGWGLWRLRRGEDRLRAFARWTGSPVASGRVWAELSTVASGHPGALAVEIAGRRGTVGLLTGRLRWEDGASGSPEDSPREQDADPPWRGPVETAIRLREQLGTDVLLKFRRDGAIVHAQRLEAEQTDERLLRDDLGDLAAKRRSCAVGSEDVDAALDTARYADVLRNPTTLGLDVFRRRWQPDGAATLATRHVGRRRKPSASAGPQVARLGPLVVVDERIERRFALGTGIARFLTTLAAPWLHRHLLSAVQRELGYAELVRHRRRVRRIKRRAEHVRSGRASRRRAARWSRRALRSLSGTSALWQERVAVLTALTRESISRLSGNADAGLLDAASSRERDAHAPDPGDAISPYDLLRERTASSGRGSGLQGSVARSRIERLSAVLAESEGLRLRTRQLWLRERAAVESLVAALSERVGWHTEDHDRMPPLSAFLSVEEVGTLSRRARAQALQEQAKARREEWARRGEITLRLEARVEDERIERLAPDAGQPSLWSVPGRDAGLTSTPERAVAKSTQGVVVSRFATDVIGVCRHVPCDERCRDEGGLESCGEGLGGEHVAVFDQPCPTLIASGPPVAAALARKGSLLCHAAINAREQALPAVFKLDGASDLRDGELVRVCPDGSLTRLTERPAGLFHASERLALRGLGGKASHLGELLHLGVPVPPFVVLSDDVVAALGPDGDDGTQRSLVTEALALVPSRTERWIVRSSAEDEDQPDRAAAGLYDSYPNLANVDEVLNACRRASVARCQRGVRLHLIVQEQCAPDVGGILFTRDPLAPEDDVLALEFSAQGAAGVTSGDGRETCLRLPRWSTKTEDQPGTERLPEKSFSRLLELGETIERHFACPQDIEWIQREWARSSSCKRARSPRSLPAEPPRRQVRHEYCYNLLRVQLTRTRNVETEAQRAYTSRWRQASRGEHDR